MRFSIDGHFWQRRLAKKLVAGGEPCDGKCYFAERVIRIQRGLSPRDEFETDLHEFTHASRPDLNEETVTQFASDATALFFDKLGYRRP